jgi:hypothetical protein
MCTGSVKSFITQVTVKKMSEETEARPDEKGHGATANLPVEDRRRVPLPFEGPPPEDHRELST